MTNKPMLSVELRELLVRINNLHATGNDIDIEMKELRALLDNPVFESEVDRLERRCKNAELALKVQTENCEALKAAQHQGEPVAKSKPVAKLHAERLTGRDGEYGVTVEDSEWINTCRLTGGIFNLYAEQPAPVVTVAKLTQAVHDVAGFPGVTGYQLRELADRLNGVKP